jgi:hypothetical protein
LVWIWNRFMGSYFLMGGAQTEVVELPLVGLLAPGAALGDLGLGLAVAEAEQLVTVELPTAALLPQLRGQYRGHEQLLAPVLGQFLADDLLELADAPEGQRQVAVNAGGHLLDHAGAHHELLAHHIGIARRLAQGLDQELGLLHGGL